jgi:AcrR family transcriptional regulator
VLARQTEQQKNEARLRVLAAAVEEFARHGLANARVRSIVDAARVNLAAVNYYFGGKEGLYHATLMSLAVRLEPLDVAKFEAARTPRDRLRICVAMILAGLSTQGGPTALARILTHETLARSGHLGAIFAEVLPAEVAWLRSIVRGIVASDSREEAVARIAEVILGRCLLYLHGATSFDAAAREILATHIAESAVADIERARIAPVAEK